MHPDRDEPKPTAALLLANARSFLPARLEPDVGRGLDHQLHMVAIAIELALKAALLDTGETDFSNRIFIGHDLAEAADQAHDRGLRVSRPLRALIAVLHPYYMEGGFQRGRARTWPRIARRARAITAALIDEVDQAIGSNRLRPRTGPPAAGWVSTIAVLALAVYLPSVRLVFFTRPAASDPEDRDLVRAIRRLPIVARGVFLMSCRSGFSYPVIARLTFMPVRRVGAQLAGALLALSLDARDDDEPRGSG